MTADPHQPGLIRLVAQREMGDRIRNRTFIVMTVLTALVLVGFTVGPALFGGADGPTQLRLGVSGDPHEALLDALQSGDAAFNLEVSLVVVEDESAGMAALESGELDAVLADNRLLVGDGASAVPALQALVDQSRQQAAVLTALEDRGIDRETAAAILGGVEPVTVVTEDGDEGPDGAAFALGFIATILLFLIIQVNGSTLLNGAVEEKSSRVVEVLLGTLRPWQLLAGKLVGLSVLALGQLGLFVGSVLGANAVVGAVDLPAATGQAIMVGTLMLLFGFAFYATLFGVAGSLASSMEDAQAAAGPLMFLTAGAYGGTILGVMQDPDGVFAQILTWFPPTAPFAVPARVALGSLGTLEIVGVCALMAVATLVTVRIAGRLYSAAVLAGGRLSWREVFRTEPVGW